jgi:hypothetical protein
MTSFDHVTGVLRELGLTVRGAFHPVEEDAIPSLDCGSAVRTMLIVGNAGPTMWRSFKADRGHDHKPDSMNRWTTKVMTDVAGRLSAGVWFPFQGPPYLPFQRWAQRAESVWSSPIGILVHREFGLWHAYRAALGFPEALVLPTGVVLDSPCLTCRDQPCLSTCPVSAVGSDGYAAAVCREHIARDAGKDCMNEGCRARRACPVGREFTYEPEQANFHMSAFLSAAPLS